MDKRYTRSEFLFLTAYVLWLLLAAIRLTYLKNLFAFSTVNGYVEKIVMALLVLKLIEDDRYGLRGIIGMVIVGMMYYISISANAPGIMIPVYFIFSARNVDYREIFKATMLVQLGVMAVSVVCSLSGVIPNEVWDEETRARYSLGYTYCTYGSHISLFLMLIYISLRRNINLAEMTLLLGWNYMWYHVTDTRTDLLLCIPAVIACYLSGRLKLSFYDRRMANAFYMLAAPVIGLGVIAAQVLFNPNDVRWSKIDSILHERLRCGHDAIAEYDLKMWGQYIKWVGAGGYKLHPDWKYNYVDCAYLKYLLHYGIVFLILLLIGLVLVGTKVSGSGNHGLQAAFMVWLVYGAIDAEFFELNFQPFMLLLGYVFTEWKGSIYGLRSGKRAGSSHHQGNFAFRDFIWALCAGTRFSRSTFDGRNGNV